MESSASRQRRDRVREYIEVSSKSPVAAVIYTLIYGPFGCIDTDPRVAIVAIFLAVALGLVYWPLIGLVWIGCVVAAPFQVRAYNARIRRSAKYVVM